MWNWFNCRVSGRHDFAMSSESGAVFLCCAHCGRRSSGWSVETKARTPVADAARAKSEPRVTSAPVLSVAAPAVRILPFTRSVSEKREHAPSRPASPANNSDNLEIDARAARLPGARSPLVEGAPGEQCGTSAPVLPVAASAGRILPFARERRLRHVRPAA
jgi:hypothetical protein